MKKSFSLILAICVLAAGMWFSGCSKKDQKGGDAGGAGRGAAGQRGPGGGGRGGRGGKPEMKLAKAEFKPIILKRQYVGEVSAAYSVEIRSTGSGWLKTLSVDIGQKVSKGQVLCVVDQDEMRAQKEQVEAQNQLAQAQNQQAKAGIAVAESSVARAEADLQQALNDDARTEAMYEKKLISRSDYENQKTTVKKFQAALDASKAQLAQAKAQLAQSSAQLAQAGAQLKTAQVKLNYLTVRAPFSGVVAERYVDAGAYVSPSVSIVKVVDDSAVKVVVNATEEDITRVSNGAEAAVTSDAWPGRVFTGTVSRVSPVVETGSRTGAVEILVRNPTGELKAGMMARVDLVVMRIPSALVVPADAVVIDQATGGKYVAVMQSSGPARRDVQTGVQAGEEVEITGGLAEGDTVILGGMPAAAGPGSGPGGGKGPGGGRAPQGGKGGQRR